MSYSELMTQFTADRISYITPVNYASCMNNYYMYLFNYLVTEWLPCHNRYNYKHVLPRIISVVQ